jgi:hypothetical protein
VSVNACGGKSDPSSCFDNARRNILDGVTASDVVSVDQPNSIDNRLTTLLHYLVKTYPEEGWARFLLNGAPKWTQIAVSGHSQGGGEAAMIAKLRVTARVVLFSAPPDFAGPPDASSTPDSCDVVNGATVVPIPVPAASWEATGHVTPSSKYWGLAHDKDQNYGAICAGWVAFGMTDLPLVVIPALPNPPPQSFDSTHTLVTELLPQTPAPPQKPNPHGSTALNDATPLGQDGAPLLSAAWHYLLTAQMSDDEE